MDFSTSFPPLACWLLGASLGCCLLALWGRWLPVWRAGSAAAGVPAPNSGSAFPFASVIVYSTSAEEELTAWLETAMAQDYPAYEVIVVNEGSAETSSSLAERLTLRWPRNLYVTFIPHEAHNLSRRKLAITVGMKAAKGDVVVTTAANCSLPGHLWLRSLLAPFASSTLIDVALGYSRIDFRELHGAGKWFRGLDFTLTGCMWLGAAANGRPYRGDGNNLAFRRSLFFDRKGYARTIHMINGDDDLFLREIMNPGNTAVAVSPDSILTAGWNASANRMLLDIKERYAFTARFLPRGPFLRAGLGSAMQWGALASGAAGAVAGLPSLLPAAAALATVGSLWLTEIILYRRTASRLGSVRLWWSLPWLMLWLPLGNLLFRLRHRRVRKHYTFR